MRLLEQIGSPAVKVYYDVGNSTDKGRDVAREIRLLRDLICEFHFKDGEFCSAKDGSISAKSARQSTTSATADGFSLRRPIRMG